MEKKFLNVRDAAAMLGISSSYLRRHPSAFPNIRTLGQHRRYCIDDIRQYLNKPSRPDVNYAIIYIRTLNAVDKGKHEAAYQTQQNLDYCTSKEYSIIRSVTEHTGMYSNNQPKLCSLIKSAYDKEFTKLIVTEKYIISRSNFDIISATFRVCGVDIEYSGH